MRTPAVLVPFKGEMFKSRLSPILNTEERRELAFLLLADLLRTLKRAGLGQNSYVISYDSEAERIASRFGSSFILERKAAGVNSAVRRGVRKLRSQERFMVLPSDLAMLTTTDLDTALAIAKAIPVVMAPSSSFNGTNLMLFPRRMTRSLSYDNNSFWNHLAGAARLGLATAVLTRRGLVFDVDTPADAAELAESGVGSGAARFLRGKSS